MQVEGGQLRNNTIAYLVVALMIGALLLSNVLFIHGDSSPSGPTTFHVGKGFTYETIGSAVKAASEGDWIVVHRGTYNESIVIDKRLEIHGTDMNGTIIDGKGITPLLVLADNCRISGFNLTGGITNGWNGEEIWTAGIELRSDRNEVYGCFFQNNYFGAFFRDSDDNWIHDSIASDNRHNGLYLKGSSGNRFDSFHSNNNGQNGISIFVSPDNDFYHCKSEENNNNGWEIQDSEREYIRFSTSIDNDGSGFSIGGSFDKNWLENCRVIGNGEDGLWIHVEAYQFIENCTIASNNGVGIHLPYNGYSSMVIAYNNLIINNTDWAVRMDRDCDDSEFFRNDIINNRNGQSPQVTDDGDNNIWNKGTTGNHWSDWIGPDGDRNGIVDTPYRTNGGSPSADDYPSVRRFTNHTFGGPSGSEPFIPVIIKTVPADAFVGKDYVFYIDVVDRDTDFNDLVWEMETEAEWLSLETNILQGRPEDNDRGIHTVRIWVSDGVGTDEMIFDVKVVRDANDLEENRYPPSIVTTHVKDAFVGEAYSRTYSAQDQDTDDEYLLWKVTTTADFLVMNGDTLQGTPGEYDVGAFTVSILVSDGDYWDISSFTIMVHPSRPVIDDDEMTEIEVIDIVQGPRMETGETILSVKDLTGGKVDFIEYEWFVNGAKIGSTTYLIVFLEEGTHTITLRARALDNDWYEVNREVKVGNIPDSNNGIDKLALVVVIVLLVIIVIVMVSFIYTRRRRGSYSQRSEDAVGYIDGNGPSNVHGGRLGQDHISEREITAFGGPSRGGPHSSFDMEYRQISEEALSWKRPSKFSMDKDKMDYKLRVKYDMGEIDQNLHKELRHFIDDHFREGNR